MHKLKGKHKSKEHIQHLHDSGTLFAKGHIPWNKGTKGAQVGWSKGLTKETNKSLAYISEKTKGRCNYWTPYYNTLYKKGKHLSKEHREKLSASGKYARSHHAPVWNKGLTKETDDRLRKLGKTISRVTKGVPRPFHTNKQGTRRFWYYGKKCRLKMRSRWEVAYAHYLDRNKVKWLYEYCTFVLDKFSYTPDFYLTEYNQFIEIKGYEPWVAYKKYCKVKWHYGIDLLIIREMHLRAIGALH